MISLHKLPIARSQVARVESVGKSRAVVFSSKATSTGGGIDFEVLAQGTNVFFLSDFTGGF
jgi:hypothetical protein